jgi:hypothetical protein
MKASTDGASKSATRIQEQLIDVTGRTIIHSRYPVFALTTAVSCAVAGGILLCQGSWRWCGALTAISVCMAVWQMRIAFHSPILMISGSIATLSCEGEDASIYMLSDLAVVQGNVPTCLAFLTAASIGIPMVAIGLFANLESSLSLSLSSTQRILVSMSGLWFSGTAISIAYLDFPRRKLFLGTSSPRRRIIFLASRVQRRQLDVLLHALTLEAVMQRVGLGSYIGRSGRRDVDSTDTRENGLINETPVGNQWEEP